MFISIRSRLLLTTIYAPDGFGGFTTEHITTGFGSWIISALASTAFAICYLIALRYFLAKRPGLVDKTYGLFFVSLLMACCFIIVLPPLVIGWD